MTNAERQKRYRRRFARLHPSPKTVAKQQRRAAKEVALAERIDKASAALGSKLYGVIYMDPASRFIVWSRETGLDRAADNHYPTEFWDDIAARAPPAYKDAILLCWSTRAQAANTIRMAEGHWGFVYKTCFVWGKEKRAPGTQDLALNKTAADALCEHLFPPVIEIPRSRQHSEKPEIYAEMIERLWPTTPKIEIYYEPKQDPAAAQAHIEKRQAAGWDLWPPP